GRVACSLWVVQDFEKKTPHLRGLQAGLRGFARGVTEKFARVFQLRLARAVASTLRDEGAEPLPPEDDPLALQLLVGALDRDHADEQLLRELAEGRQRIARLTLSPADRA